LASTDDSGQLDAAAGRRRTAGPAQPAIYFTVIEAYGIGRRSMAADTIVLIVRYMVSVPGALRLCGELTVW
jgi:hypothetical protein